MMNRDCENEINRKLAKQEDEDLTDSLIEAFEKLSIGKSKGEKFVLPIVENVCPWMLEEKGWTFREWCLHKDHIYVGLQMKRLLGPLYNRVPEEAKLWECRYNGPDRLKKYKRCIKKNLWNQLWRLSGKKLGCYCYTNEKCHCKELVQICKRKYKLK